MKTASLQFNPKRSDRRESQASVLLPDPENPLQLDSAELSSLVRRTGESESKWIGRLELEIDQAAESFDDLLIVREAILHEIGFYDLEPGRMGADGLIDRDGWRVLATLQNIPEDGWQDAISLGPKEREEFERTGLLPIVGAIGPDGEIYHRLSFRQDHPVGSLLQTVDELIRLRRPPELDLELAAVLAAVVMKPSGRLGGIAPRSIVSEVVAPRVSSFIRSQGRSAAAATAIGASLALSSSARREGTGESEMEPAPDLPPAPGLEPPEDPETERETFPADLPPIPPLPGFMPEDYADLVEVFPDQDGELPLVDILDRWGSPETQLFNSRTMRAVRDLAKAIGVEVWHLGGGRPDDKSDYEKELWLPAGGEGGGTVGSSYLDIAFKSDRTGRKLLINTIDTRADNMTPTTREERAAIRILANSKTGDILILLPKPPRGQTYDFDRFLEWLRPHLEEIDRDLPKGSEGHQRRFDFH